MARRQQARATRRGRDPKSNPSPEAKFRTWGEVQGQGELWTRRDLSAAVPPQRTGAREGAR